MTQSNTDLQDRYNTQAAQLAAGLNATVAKVKPVGPAESVRGTVTEVGPGVAVSVCCLVLLLCGFIPML